MSEENGSRESTGRAPEPPGFLDRPLWGGKSLWAWLTLLMVPVVVGGLAAWFQVVTNDRAQKSEYKN